MNTIFFIIFTAILFFLFFVIGKIKNKSNKWIFIDPIYYFLGAIGIIILFSIEYTDREIAKLKAKEEILELEIYYINLNKPIPENKINLEFTSTMFNYLEIVSINSGSCSLESGEVFTCFASTKLKPLIDKLIEQKNKIINSNETDKEKIINICNNIDSFLNNLEEKQILSTFTTVQLLEHYQLGLKNNFDSMDYNKLKDYIESFQTKQINKIEENPYFRNLNYNDRTKAMIMQETKLSILILKSFSGCFLYNDLSDNEYSEWSKKYKSIIEEQKNIISLKDELIKKQKEITHEKSFKLFIWPYILIIILSLKFGKGIAQIYSK